MELLAVAIAIAFAAVGSAIGQGIASSKAMESMARQPELAGTIRTTLLLALAFMEALTLFAMVVAILIWFKVA